MFGIHDLWLFVVAGIALNLTPGPDTALIVTRSLGYGAKAGRAAALGIGVGCLVHILAAALGLSALILASEQAFMVIKLLGAAYLFYLGVTMILSRENSVTAQAAGELSPLSAHTVFWQGFLSNVMNPKVALFFLAFLPQFVDGQSPQKALAFLTLGLIFNFTGTIWNLILAQMAGYMSRAKGFARFKLWLERGLGVLFVGLAARLALAQKA